MSYIIKVGQPDGDGPMQYTVQQEDATVNAMKHTTFDRVEAIEMCSRLNGGDGMNAFDRILIAVYPVIVADALEHDYSYDRASDMAVEAADALVRRVNTDKEDGA